MNKCFLLNSEKKFGANPFCRFWENANQFRKSDIIKPKARRLGSSNSQLTVSRCRKSFESNGTRKPETDF